MKLSSAFFWRWKVKIFPERQKKMFYTQITLFNIVIAREGSAINVGHRIGFIACLHCNPLNRNRNIQISTIKKLMLITFNPFGRFCIFLNANGVLFFRPA